METRKAILLPPHILPQDLQLVRVVGGSSIADFAGVEIADLAGVEIVELRKALAPSFSRHHPDQYRWVDTEWRNVE